MQIRLTKRNSKRLVELVGLYKKTAPDYDLSFAQQVNLLIGGRLDLAIKEAKKDYKKCKRTS